MIRFRQLLKQGLGSEREAPPRGANVPLPRNGPLFLFQQPWERSYRCCLLVITLAIVCLTSADGLAQNRGKGGKRPRDVASFRRQHAERRAKFAAQLNELARTCDEKGLPEAAAEIRQLSRPVEPSELRLTAFPRQVQPALPQSLPAEERAWRVKLRAHQLDYSKELYALSKRAADAGHVGLALDLIREIMLHDSDHVNARRILGFKRSGNEWVSTFEAEMQKNKMVWTEMFGWLPRDHVERYEHGERYYKPRKAWISAAKEAELRQDWLNAWEIKTEHYLVKTNHSLERGVDLAKKLEDFHGLFFQMMSGFFNSSAEVKQLFAGSSGRIATPKNVVHYYRTRREYIAVLKPETTQPIEITRGIYFPRNKIAFFFYDPESDDDSTLYHEATHQLLSGSRPTTAEIGIKSDFWLIEGIACYMESFRRDGDKFSVGDPGHQRLRAARMHFVDENYYMPLQEFTRMGMDMFQRAPQIRKNYSQGAALTHFFLHYDEGRYREALIEHLSQIYSPTKAVRDNPESLAELTGVDDEELDRQFGDYIRQLAPSAKMAPAPAAVDSEEP